MPKCTFPDKPEELEKMLASMALAGAQVCGFDNLDPSPALRGAPLDKVLSGRDVQFRILGQSMMPILRWNGVVMVTGNNAQPLGDTTRRTRRSRQEPTVERPEERTGFRIPDVRGHVRKHRGELVVAGLTVLRAYVVAGRPTSNAKPWGSYEQWQSSSHGGTEKYSRYCGNSHRGEPRESASVFRPEGGIGMTEPTPSLLAALETLADLLADRVAKRLLTSEQDGWVDQSASPLGPRRHRKAVTARVAAGAPGAAKVGRRHLLSKDALSEELSAIGKRKPKRAAPAEPSFEAKLRAELRLVGGDS